MKTTGTMETMKTTNDEGNEVDEDNGFDEDDERRR
jgi:hypothetical protein